MHSNSSLIFTFSGIRGIAGKDLNKGLVEKLAFLFGERLQSNNRRVIIGRDTRPSGLILEEALIAGLSASNFKEIYNVGICPTPVLIFMKNQLNIEAGIIITGSHNPPEWNGLKLIKDKNYLNDDELRQLKSDLKERKFILPSEHKQDLKIKKIDPFKDYLKTLYSHINFKKIKKSNDLRVVLDTGAGAGKFVTPKLLMDLGCEVNNVNNELLVNGVFPRGIEPIAINLHDLIMEVWQGKYDIGFAHDTDADRLAIIGDDGSCYPEDIGLALIMEYTLQNLDPETNEAVFITNLASSLVFDKIAEKYGARIVRTPIGEIYLVNMINNLRKQSPDSFIFGGEGSCGGVIYPDFNNTRDGIFAVAKIIEILSQTGEKMSRLVSKLPKFFSHREIIKLNSIDINSIIRALKEELEAEGETVEQINQDLKFGIDKEYFILIHPSNTEPIIRIISEAKSKSLARVYCQTTKKLMQLIISNL